MSRLTHINQAGEANMVDVGDKPVTNREATARVMLRMQPATVALITEGQARKGDVLGVARIAGILAAKRTDELIPLCHSLPLNQVNIGFKLLDDGVEITATASTLGKTGVEMEALTAASVAALTVYDMVKAADRAMRIDNLRLIAKTGGKSGDFRQD